MTTRALTKEELEEIERGIKEIKAQERVEAKKLIEYYYALPDEEFDQLAAKVASLLSKRVRKATKDDIGIFIDITCAYEANDAADMFKSFTGGYLLQDILEMALPHEMKERK